jgi:PPOX class probable FMN-dependent enzyme
MGTGGASSPPPGADIIHVVTTDPFALALQSTEDLRALYPPPLATTADKEADRLNELCQALIACAPLVFVASVDADGSCDVSPRGGQPGFATVLDERHVALPDATGNRRLDTLRNVVATRRAGLIFVVPGRGQTLRINGPACVTADPAVLDRLTPVGKPPVTAIVVETEQVFTHCPKAFVRSRVWDPNTWLAPEDQPSPAAVSQSHIAHFGLTVEEVETSQAESLRTRLE